MKYQHHFTVNAPIQRVADFHSRASSMAAITPPPFVVRMRNTPAVLEEGDRMDFTMWIGPLPVRWVAQIENVPPPGSKTASSAARSRTGCTAICSLPATPTPQS